MVLIEVAEHQAVYSKEQIEELFKQKEEAEMRDAKNKILINQAIRVLSIVNKVFPGLASGNLMQSINPMALMNNPDLQKIGPDIQRLNELIEEYKKSNLILIQ